MERIALCSTIVKKNDAKWYWSEAYESGKLRQSLVPRLTQQYDEFKKMAAKANNPRGEYIGVLHVWVDGVKQPDVVAHMQEGDMKRIQVITHGWFESIIADFLK